MVQPIYRTRAVAIAAAAAACVVILVVGLVLAAGSGDDEGRADGSAPDPTTTTFPPAPAAPSSQSPTGTPSPAASSAPSPTPSTPAPVSRPKPREVPLKGTAELARSTTARVVKIERIEGKAELPGEVGGPAISVDIRLEAGQKIDFATAVVNAYYGTEDTPATPLTTGAKPFTGTLAKGKQATATYVFRVPEEGLGRVAIELDLSLEQPIALFRGAVA